MPATDTPTVGIVSRLHNSHNTESLFQVLKTASEEILGTSYLSVVLMNIEDDSLFVEVSNVVPQGCPLNQESAALLQSTLTRSTDRYMVFDSDPLAGACAFPLSYADETFGALIVHNKGYERADNPDWAMAVSYTHLRAHET